MLQILLIAFVIMIGPCVQAQSNYSTHGAKLFAVGDLHGDLDAFKKILSSQGLFSTETSQWTGGSSHLVIVGDVVDRGPQTKELMDFIIRLEQQAAQKQGAVHTLLGNHEILVTQGNYSFAHPNDLISFKQTNTDSGIESFVNAFKRNSIYARWLRKKKVAIKVNDILFVHAGLDSRAMAYSLDQINAHAQSWVSYYQEMGNTPDRDAKWIIAEESSGPLWTRDYAPKKSSTTMAELEQILQHFDARQIVIGHNLVTDLAQTTNHPIFGDKVISTDTGISSKMDYHLSIFELNNDSLILHEIDRVTGQEKQTRRQTRSQSLLLSRPSQKSLHQMNQQPHFSCSKIYNF